MIPARFATQKGEERKKSGYEGGREINLTRWVAPPGKWEYPYDPLPALGLVVHPFVEAILAPWLGPDADHCSMVD